MPSRASRANHTFPRSFPRLWCFPEGEVAGAVFFVFIDIDACAILHAGEIPFGKFAVAGEFCDAKIIGAVFRPISKTFCHKIGNELRHFRNVIGGADQLWLLDVQRCRVFEECFFVFRRVLLHADAIAGRVANDFVVHVGDVHDVFDFVSTLAKEALEKVHSNEGAEVADVAVIVDGGAAGIHADFVVDQGVELLDLAGERVVKAQGHSEGVR